MRRHDRVYLRRGAEFATACAAPGSSAWQAVAVWLNAGRPLVAARQAGGGGQLQLALGLPLAQGRQRLSIRVDAAQVAEVQPPLSVWQCQARLPAGPAAVLCQLAARLEGCGARLGIYGSLAWEVLSGEAYRRPDSDIDLICDVADRGQYEIALAALAAAAARLDCRLDGELRFPDGRAAAWQEILGLAGAPGKPVLVKGEQEVALLPLADLLATLPPMRQAA
jgi:phosphoribosyl-dephospho-CoA transferase